MLRPLLITLHKYSGLVLGLLLSILGLSGSILVFDHAVDEMLNPALANLSMPDGPAPLQQVVDAASAAVPNDGAATRIMLPHRPGSAHIVRFPTRPGDAGPVEVSVHPGTAEVLAVRTWGEYAATWLYYLHHSFLAGDAGHLVVGFIGLLMLFFCVSGLIIWWPRRGQWRRAFTIRTDGGAFRLNYDLHKTAGIYLLPLYLVVAFSGVYIVFKSQVEGLVDAVLPMDEHPAPLSAAPPPGAVPLSVDEAVAIGRPLFPDAELKRVYLPTTPDGAFELALNQPGEAWSTHAATHVWVDQYSGAILDTWNPLAVASGSKFIEWQFPLHNGDALGLAGRWLVFVCGLLPSLLFGTGVYMWWRKRRLQPRRRGAEELAAAGG